MPSDEPAELLDIEVVFAQPERQTVIPLRVPFGTTLERALDLSGLASLHPDLDLGVMTIGIWGKRAVRSTRLRNHDRVEVYRPLSIDPKQARRVRAKQLTRK